MTLTMGNGMVESIARKRNMLMGSSKRRMLGAVVGVNVPDWTELVKFKVVDNSFHIHKQTFLEFMCAIPGQDNYVSTIREYEGPFGDWHGERLCAPQGFLKEGQQNYQSYQGIFSGTVLAIQIETTGAFQVIKILVLLLWFIPDLLPLLDHISTLMFDT